MKYEFKTWIVVFAFLFFAAAFAMDAYAADKNEGEQKVASINGTVITQAELDKESSRFEQQMAMAGQVHNAEQTAELKKKVLDGMVSRELLVQEGKKLGLAIGDAEVDEQVSTLKKKFPSEEDFTTTLGKMSISEDELKAQFRRDMTIRKLIDREVTSKVTVSGEETKAFYDGNPELFKSPEMIRASHILVKVDQKAADADKAKAKEKMKGIQKRLKKGEDFAAVAKETSDCPSSAKGGDLDFFQRGQMVKPFEDAAFALKVGAMTDIVETQFGYHIIKVTEKKDAGVASYDEMKDKIEEHLKQQKSGEQLTQYVDRLKSGAKIEYTK